jgi:uncharacterized Zn finger protein (UPF0148 family)
MDIKVHCPHCKEALAISDDEIDLPVACPICRKAFCWGKILEAKEKEKQAEAERLRQAEAEKQARRNQLAKQPKQQIGLKAQTPREAAEGEAHKKVLKAWLVLLCILTGVSIPIVILIVYAPAVFVAILIVGIIVSVSGVSTRCPSCKKWWAESFIGAEEVDRKGGYETVTRRDRHRDGWGRSIGTTERQEQAYVTRITYLNQYRCKYCAHRWTQTSVKAHEGGQPEMILRMPDKAPASAIAALPALEQLRRDGALSDTEWEKAKKLVLERPEIKETVAQKIADLYSLYRSGALSNSEFNMKKWDLLSRKQ